VSDQARRLRELAGNARRQPVEFGGGKVRVMAVASGKGGVGKTNLVANLGWQLAKNGATVLALDADFGLANLDIVLNLAPDKNLGHVVRGEATLAEVLKTAAQGFSVLPGASGISQLADLDGSVRLRLLESLALLSGEYDYLLLDTAAGIGRNVVDLCLAAQEVLLVTDPQPTSLTDAYGLAKVLAQREADIRLRVVVNSVASAGEGRAVWTKLNSVVKRFLGREVEYLGHILRDECVGRATARQMPFVAAFPRSGATKCVEELALAVGGETLGKGERGGFWTRLASAAGG